MAEKIRCEMMLRSLCHDWLADAEQVDRSIRRGHFEEFWQWLDGRGYRELLRSVEAMGCVEVARTWFTEEVRRDVFAP